MADKTEHPKMEHMDFDQYRQISTLTAKRLYRFLFNRFGTGKHSWTVLIDKLAFKKLGMKRDSYQDITQVKHHLLSAIEILENAEFIMEMAPKERFRKTDQGVWEVHFQKFKPSKHKDQTPPNL